MLGKEKQAPKRGRILELDALRGIAVVIVLIFHLTLYRKETEYGFKLGVTGVDLFFLISGFVIFLTLQQSNNWKNFIFNRFSRLYPIYWVCVTFTAVLMIVSSDTSRDAFFGTYLGNLTMFQNYFGVPNLDEQYWTLQIEMFFYISILMIFLLKQHNRIEVLGYLFLIFICFYDVYLESSLLNVYKIINRMFPLVNHFPLFFAGILFYKQRFEKETLFRYFGLIFCFALSCMLFNNGGRSMYFINFYEYVFMLLLYFVTFALFTKRKLGFIVAVPTLFLGRISYSLYLIHQYVSTKILITNLEDKIGIPFFMAAFFALLTSLFLATGLTLFIEEPIIKYLRLIYKRNSRGFSVKLNLNWWESEILRSNSRRPF